MRVTFRAKILLALTGAVAVVLGSALWFVDGAYARQIDAITEERAAQGAATFAQLAADVRTTLFADAVRLAARPRMQQAFEAGGDEPMQIARNELEAQDINAGLLIVATKQGLPIGSPPGAADALIAQVASTQEPADGYVTSARTPFLAVAAPCAQGPRLMGIVLLGTRIDDATARRIHALQVPSDHAGYLVDGALAASSFDTPPALGGRPPNGTSQATIAGRPYRISVAPVGRDVSTVLFVSMDELAGRRARMRRQILLTGLGGFGIAIVLGLVISRGVSAPVRDLVAGTRRVANGEYSHSIAVHSNDELGDLAAAFNAMAGGLATKEKMRAVLNKVVAPEVAEELLKSDLALGGTLVRATLLFADLRGFTAMTQGMPPQTVVAMLNEFMTAMTQEVLACKGIVDKYVGDEIIALFGVPRPLGHDALAAVEAAHRMRLRLADLNVARAARGEKPLAMGIGVHTGEVVAGRMGSEQQLNYTCIGEAMNLASRLCSSAQPDQILISQATLEDAGESVEAKPLPPIPVKGFSEAVAIFEVVRVEKGATSRRRRD